MVLGEALLLVVIAYCVAVVISVPMSVSSSSAGATVFGFSGSPRYPWAWLPAIFISTVAVGVVAAVAPARRATCLEPVSVLSFD